MLIKVAIYLNEMISGLSKWPLQCLSTPDSSAPEFQALYPLVALH